MNVQELIDLLNKIEDKELFIEVQVAENTFMPVEDIGWDESIVELML